MKTKKEINITYEGVVNKVLEDSYAAISFKKGDVIKVSEDAKKRGWITRNAGHGVTISLDLNQDVTWVKRIETTTKINVEEISLTVPEANDCVKVRGAKKGSINEYARVDYIDNDGKVKVTNMNMPFLGSICEVVTPEEFFKKYELVK